MPKQAHNTAKEVAVGITRPEFSMSRYRFVLRCTAVVVAFPVIFLVILCATLLHPITSVRTNFRISLRLWLNVLDWVKEIPIGYTFWVRYQAPLMLDTIEVHHDD